MEVGFGTADITPEKGEPTSLFIEHPLEEAVTPLLLKVCYLRDKEQATVIVTLDTTSLYTQVIEDLCRTIAGATGIPHSCIIVQSSHTHSSPFLHPAAQEVLGRRGVRFLSSTYYARVLQGAGDAAKEALRNLSIVDVFYSSGVAKQVASNRRVRLADGSIEARWSRGVSDELRSSPEGTIDPVVSCIWFKNSLGQIMGSLLHYACHATAYNNYLKAHWDFPGYAASEVGHQLGGTCMFLQGCAGNISPGKYTVGEPQEDCLRMAHEIALAALDSYPTAQRLRVKSLSLVSGEVSTTLRILPNIDELNRLLDQEVAKYQEALSAGKTFDNNDFMSIAARLVLLERYPDKNMPSKVFVLGVGELPLVFLPGEMFIETSLQLQLEFSDTRPIVMAYTDASLEYVPIASAFEEQGGYETSEDWCFSVPGNAEVLTAYAAELIRKGMA